MAGSTSSIFQKAGPLQALHYLWLVVRGLHLNSPGVEHRRVRRVVVESAEPVPVQLDGDPGGYVERGGIRAALECRGASPARSM